jgi:glycosyltransferase involved in cell wall biosynthesis
MRVVFFHRKPRRGNFSIESLFRQIRKALPNNIKWEVKELRYSSNGLFKRLYISLEAMLSQKGINHITGDVHFIAIFLRKKKTVLTIHDIGFLNHPNPWIRMVLKWFWLTMPVRRSAIITTVSFSTKKEVLKHVKLDPLRIRVVPVPVAEWFVVKPQVFNKEMPTILQIGTKSNKNVIRLVQALKGIHCRLSIVGDINPTLKNELLESHLEYTNASNLSENELLQKYYESDIVAFVSTYEGFGMPIIEANAVGRVVLTSNVLSMPEVAGNAAHFVDPYDVGDIRRGILKIINEDSYRQKLINNGFENRKRFDVNRIATQYIEIYNLLA